MMNALPFLLTLPLAVLLTACEQDAAPADPQVTPVATAAAAPSAGIPILSAQILVGEYRVAGIDGAEIAGDMGIGLSIGEATISYEPHCLGYVWAMSMDDEGRLALARDPAFGPQVDSGSVIVACEPAVTPAFGQLAQALDVVDRAARTPANGIELTGGGRSVTLFSQ